MPQAETESVTPAYPDVAAIDDGPPHAPPRPVAWNSFFGVLAFGLPTAAVFVAYPLLIDGIGPERFGVFVLAISLMGAAGTLDLGIAPATTHFVARNLGAGDGAAAARTVSTSLAFYSILGFLCGLSIWLAAPWLAETFSNNVIPDADGAWVFRLSGIQVGILFLINVCSATFKGLQRFEWPALLLSGLSVSSYGGALVAMILFGPNLVAMMAGLVAGYFVVGLFAITLLGVVLRHFRMQLLESHPSLTAFRDLLRFGLVMTGNSIAGFLLYQVQRYVVGAFIGPHAVTVYQLATVIPSKVQTLVASGTEVLFPYTSSRPERRVLRRTYVRMLAGGAGLALALLGALALFSDAVFELWVGNAIAAQVSSLIPAFAAAYFFIATTAAPFHLANGLGRPHLITAFYLFDGLINVALLAVLLPMNLALESVAFAFLFANLLTAGAYQLFAELVLWRSSRT